VICSTAELEIEPKHTANSLKLAAQRRTTTSTTADPVDTLSQTKANSDRHPAVY